MNERSFIVKSCFATPLYFTLTESSYAEALLNIRFGLPGALPRVP